VIINSNLEDGSQYVGPINIIDTPSIDKTNYGTTLNYAVDYRYALLNF
jgi:hypothetical protein